MSNGLKAIKIAVGSTVAILLAYAIGLNYAVAAGIITILSIQDTKKETILVVLKRIVAFVLSTLIAVLTFYFLSYSVFSYGIYLLAFSGLCLVSGLKDAIPVNAVLATHFFLDKSIHMTTITNEALLMGIGAGVGLFLNLFIFSNVKQIRVKQHAIEECLKILLFQMADELVTDFDSPMLDDKFIQLKNHVNDGIQYAHQNRNNTLFQESEYFLRYMEMRMEQITILRETIDKIKTVEIKIEQSEKTATFLREIANSLSESQNSTGLLEQQEKVLEKFREDALPATRQEFEARAVLYVILMNLRLFLKVKKRFSDALTPEQIKKYWIET